MNRLKLGAFAILLFGCGFFANQVFDDVSLAGDSEAQKLDLTRELMVVTGFDRATKIYMDEYARQMVASWKQTLPSPLSTEAEKALESELSLRLTKEYKALEPDLTKLFAKHFSLSEIQGVLEFYHSPLGRSLLAKFDAYETEMYAITGPVLNSSAERHWLAVVDDLRAQGKL